MIINILDRILFDIFVSVIVSIILTGLGAMKLIYNYYKKIRKRRKIKNFFGENCTKKDKLIISLPVFHPLSYDNFENCEHSHVKKTIISKNKKSEKKNLDKIIVPMNSDTLVIDDFHGFTAIKDFLMDWGLGYFVKLKTDEELIKIRDWKTYPCIIGIGGPRSNQKTKQILNDLAAHLKFFEIHDENESLENWVLKIDINERNYKFGVKENMGLGIICRFPNPVSPRDYLLSIFGDRSETTVITCQYLDDFIIEQSSKIENGKSFIALISIKGFELTMPEVCLISTKNEVIYKNEELFKKYLIKN